MLKYRLSQIAPLRDNSKGGRKRKSWTVKKKKRMKSKKSAHLPANQITCIDSTTNNVTESESFCCSSTEEDYGEECQNRFEIPTLSDFIRTQLYSVLRTYRSRCRYEMGRSKPLAVLTSSVSKDKENVITWNCKDIMSGKLWFAETSTLEKMEMSKEMLNDHVCGYSLYARTECERKFVKLLKNMERHKCSHLEITCNSVKAVLHLDKFYCPGATRRCVEYNGTLVTPVELMRAVCPFNPKDWKYHFKVHNNGSILGFLFDSAKLDFTDHEKFCTQLCLPLMQAPLIELNEKYNIIYKEPLPNKCCLPFCRNNTPKTGQEWVTYHTLPKEKEKCELWLQNMGVLQHVMEQDFEKIREANLKLCSDHFDDDQFFSRNHSTRRRLKQQAVPTVIEKEIFSDTISLNMSLDEKQVPDDEIALGLLGANASGSSLKPLLKYGLSTSCQEPSPMGSYVPSLKESSLVN